MTLDEFTYGFVNTFSAEQAAAAYERYAVPETGQIFYEAGFANFHFHPPTEVHMTAPDWQDVGSDRQPARRSPRRPHRSDRAHDGVAP